MLSDTSPRWLRPLPVILALVAWLVVGGIGGAAGGKLSSVQKNDAALFLPSSAESTRAAELSAAFEPDQTLPALVVLRPSDGGRVTPAQLAAVQQTVAGIPGLPVTGGDGTWGDHLIADPVVAPAADGLAILVVLPLDAAAADQLLPDGDRTSTVFVADVRAALLDQLGAGAAQAGDLALNAWVTGPAGFVADLVSAFAGIDGVLLFTALGAVLLILVIVYRSPFLPLAVISTAVFALALAGFVVYELAAHDVLVLNGQSQGILSILVVGASVDYSLLLVARYREELTRHEHPAAAMAAALRAALEPIAASAGTVIAGVLCLLLSELGSNRSLGPVAAIGVVASFLAALTLLPALLLLPGRRARVLFWPRVPRPGQVAGSGGAWVKVSATVVRRARLVGILAVVLLAGAAAFAPGLDTRGSDQTAVFLTKVDAVEGQRVLAEHFPAGAVQPAVVLVAQDEADTVVAAAEKVDGVDSAAVFTGTPALPGAAPVVVDGLVRVDVVTSAASDSQAAVDAVERLRTSVHAVAPDALVGGAAAQTLDTRLAGQRDLLVIIPVVLLVIALILALLLRSVVAPLVLLGANVLSFAAAMGVAALVFGHLPGWGSADPTVPLYGFVFLVALGVDYSIFLMTRVREESQRAGTRRGVQEGLAVTGGVITSAGLVLAATFAALAVIPLLFLAQLAFIVAFGVLLDTFVVRTLLVPALVVQLDRRTWWPSRLGEARR
ncbi:MAG: MMPL family transporter [Actinobacteria bacterium]|nr:MMPL family transporter [Actinomycetota bacterium]MCG2802241.1 MMPL family transporter [Cellulomonas sp.]